MRRLAAFVDFDGTVTDLDTFDVLVQHAAGAEAWAHLEACLRDGTMTLREVLARQASFVRLSLDEADALLQREVRFDASFPAFVEACRARGIPVTMLSSGIRPLIERALARHGVGEIELVASDVDPDPAGWRLRFHDDVPNGTDKARIVREARAAGMRTLFAGDGHSDFDAALEADDRYAKRGRALERHLTARAVPFTSMSTFADLIPILDAAPA